MTTKTSFESLSLDNLTTVTGGQGLPGQQDVTVGNGCQDLPGTTRKEPLNGNSNTLSLFTPGGTKLIGKCDADNAFRIPNKLLPFVTEDSGLK